MKRKIVLALVCCLGILAAAVPVGLGIQYSMEKEAEKTQETPVAETFEQGRMRLEIQPQAGRYSVFQDGVCLLGGIGAGYRAPEEKTAEDYSSRQLSSKTIQDRFGEGMEISLVSQQPGLPTMTQIFRLYKEQPFVLTQMFLTGESGLTVQQLSPLRMDAKGKTGMKEEQWTRFLEVPFDNDGWVKFKTKSLGMGQGASMEAAALFAPQGSGLILGSLSHDTWKTGIHFQSGLGGLKQLEVCAGADTGTFKEQSPHGTVSGDRVDSPWIYLGGEKDWQEGLRAFARANTTLTPRKESARKTSPIGWNSWGAVQSDLSLERALELSDTVRNQYQADWQEKEPVYINLDSHWDNMTDEELAQFVAHCKANGQEAGIYWAPFVSWLDENALKTTPVENTQGKTLYQDVVLKKTDGTSYSNALDGCYPLDVTHPAVKKRMDYFIGRFKKAGFTYLKLDFMSHGALEGQHTDQAVQTGMQAYNQGMAYLTQLIDGSMFVNLSIAPTFPYQYADGKRLACDAYYKSKDTRYTLNAVTYGFWERELYTYPDPDHLVVWGKDGKASLNEGRSRITSGIVTGGSFLFGDDLARPAGDAQQAQARFQVLLKNPRILKAEKLGTPFTPMQGNSVKSSAQAYLLEQEDCLYLALFNFSPVPKAVLAPLPEGVYQAEELWSGAAKECTGDLSAFLKGKDAALYRLTKLPGNS